jgi:hypothetical protein
MTEIEKNKIHIVKISLYLIKHHDRLCGLSSSQSSWLQIRRPGLDSRHYQKKVVGLERGSLSLEYN